MSLREVPGRRNSTETISSRVYSELLFTDSTTASSREGVSRYPSDTSIFGSCHPASVTGTTETSSVGQSSHQSLTSQRTTVDGTEIPNWDSAPSGNLNLFSMMMPGFCQNPVSPLLTDSRNVAQRLGCVECHGRTHSAYEDYLKTACSAAGNLRIVEVDPGGHFVKILNCDPECEESIGDYLLKQQDVQGRTVAVFQFPPNTKIGPNSTVTVWAAHASVLHLSPSLFVWKDLERFKTSLDFDTILCDPSGQAVAWYTPLYWNRMQEWVAKKENEKLENAIIPTFSKAKQIEGWENEQEFTIADTHWKRTDPWQIRKKRQSFIKREKNTFAPLFPNQSAWCQSPDSSTHPHFSLVRPLTMGNDGSSLCRQSRCQSSRPDPMPGTLYAGTSRKKNLLAPSCVSAEGRRSPTQSAREEEMHI